MQSHSLRIIIFLLFLIYSEFFYGIPIVSSVNPVSGSVAGGNLVTITGSGFMGASVINFGNKTASTFNVISDSTIQAIAPVNSPGVNEITVTAPSGTSQLNPPADYYTYQGDWLAYIPDFGSADVIPINVTTQISGTPIPVGAGPNDVVVTPNGKIAISVNSNSDSITLIDVATQTPIVTLPVAGSAFPILAVTPDGTKAAIVGYSSDTVTIINLITFTTQVVPVESAPSSIAIIPQGNFAYVTNSGSSSLTQINLQTLAPVTIPGPLGSQPTFIEITPDGNTAIVSDDATNSVYIFNPKTLTFGLQITGFSLQGAGLLPEIAITPDGTTAWVTNTSSNTISSVVGLNTATPSFGSTIIVGGGPNGIAITPDGKQAYVSNATTDNVSIVTFSIGSSISKDVGITPTDPGITPDQAPVAYFTVSQNISGQPTIFDASSSVSPVGYIASYEWNFGDGSPIVITNSPMITHIYAQSGVFPVTLIVTNSAGTSLIQNFTGQVMLNNGGPSAELDLNIAIDPSLALGFTGYRCKNKFAAQTEYVNKLSWKPSSDPLVVKYLLFRNGVLIATIPANGHLKFTDHDRRKNQIDIYELIAVDTFGLQSQPSIITVH